MKKPHRRPPRAALAKFFRTPKGLLIVVLAGLAALAAPGESTPGAWINLAAAALAAMAIDAPILRWREGEWQFPSGALLTGLFVAMLLSPHEPWGVIAATTGAGILSKYLFRTASANVFNPAALAVVASFHVFGTGHSWWGALPDLSPWMVAVLVATGAFITDRVNKMPLVLVFLSTYFLLFTASAFAAEPGPLAEIYRAPDLQMVLFFAFFILTDPPTSPVQYRDQLICGVLVALVSYAAFQLVGAAYYLLAGVLVGNVWEAWRRVQSRKRKRSRVTAGHATA
jgi:Na+-translocating ferredoxin:NAD+ oxidoreductase RnfD subunit